jgi:hypothetical protein
MKFLAISSISLLLALLCFAENIDDLREILNNLQQEVADADSVRKILTQIMELHRHAEETKQEILKVTATTKANNILIAELEEKKTKEQLYQADVKHLETMDCPADSLQKIRFTRRKISILFSMKQRVFQLFPKLKVSDAKAGTSRGAPQLEEFYIQHKIRDGENQILGYPGSIKDRSRMIDFSFQGDKSDTHYLFDIIGSL